MTPEEAKLLGGSDAPAILGVDPYRTAWDVWNRVVAGVETPDTPILRRGRRYEPVLRQIAQEDFRLNLLGPRSARDPLRPWLRGSLDDEHEPDSRDLPAEPVELKSVSPFNAQDLGESGTDHVKESWVLQCQVYLHMARAERCHVVAGIGLDDTRHFILTADAELQGLVLDAMAKFHRDFVVTQRPPPIDGSSGCAEWLAKRFPENRLKTLPATAEAEQWAAKYLNARRQRERWEESEASARANLVALVGEADGLRAQGWSLSYPLVKGRKKTDWEAVAKECNASPILIEKHTTTGAPHRRFTLKESGQ